MHFTAFLCAFSAGFRAFVAMRIVVLTAFISAAGANLGAQMAYLTCIAAVETHELRSTVANSCAFHIQLNAVGHRFGIFLQAG